MKSKKEFIKLVDTRFFKHLNTKSLIPFKENRKHAEYLSFVYDNLLSNITNYKSKEPRKYISIPKNRYVIRMVPTFELDDYCIYYFSLKVLEDYIAENRVAGTFGGFRLGGKLRDKENQEFEPAFEDSYNENSFNLFAWKQEYGEYQAKLYETALKMGTEYQFAVHFDIANFYDCIRLDLLENKIRNRVNNNSCNDEIHLLFRFLKYWNSRFDSEKSVGIPQDEVGDCSRILSNFFLQDYDQFIFNQCYKKDACFLRYADDQIIFTKSKEDAEELMYLASHKLFEEGLNINTGKTKEFNNFQEFDDVYGFSIGEKLKFDQQDINKAFEMFIIKKGSCVNFRESSILRRLLHDKIKIGDLHNQKRIKLLSYLWDESFLLFSNDHYMKQIYKMLKDNGEKEEYLSTLESIGEKTSFESYKIHLEKFKIELNKK
jgi:hypothetical protein